MPIISKYFLVIFFTHICIDVEERSGKVYIKQLIVTASGGGHEKWGAAICHMPGGRQNLTSVNVIDDFTYFKPEAQKKWHAQEVFLFPLCAY